MTEKLNGEGRKKVNTLFVGVGGALGAVMRYLIDLAGNWIWPFSFPLATLVINLSGCFALGWLNGYVFKQLPVKFQAGIGAGIIGALTTFSTLSVDVVRMIESGDLGAALIDFLISSIGGLICSALGYQFGSGIEERKRMRK